MSILDRRQFIKGSVGAATTLGIVPKKTRAEANEKIVIGVMGLGGRGAGLTKMFAERDDTVIAYLCDPNTNRFARASDIVTPTQNTKPKVVQDFRRMLDDSKVDVLINATPDHWHGLGTIMACQAGKDVYVEKPMAHNIYEGRKIIEAARKYKRIIQVGMQTRSAPYIKNARDYIQSGAIGDVHLIRIFNMMQHPMRRPGPDQPVPDSLDYDLWCGPAAKLPYNPSRRWLNYRQYSCGPIAGDAVHQLDLARYLLGDPEYPETVSNAGGVFSLTDGRDCADTQITTYEYGKTTMLVEAALWSPYMKKTPLTVRNSDAFPNFPFSSTKIEVCGTKGFVYVGRHGGGWQVYDSNCKLSHSEFGRQADKEHQDNFIECIRTRKQAAANAEQGHYSVLLCHLANISGWVSNEKLRFDPKTESFGDNLLANKYLKRRCRPPWLIPENV